MAVSRERQEAVLRRLAERKLVDGRVLAEVRSQARREQGEVLDLLVARGHVSAGAVRALLRLESGETQWTMRALVAVLVGVGCVGGLGLAAWCVGQGRPVRTVVRTREAPPTRPLPVPAAATEPAVTEPPAAEPLPSAPAADRELGHDDERLRAERRELEARLAARLQDIVPRLQGQDRAAAAAAVAGIRELLANPSIPDDLLDGARDEALRALEYRRTALLERWRTSPAWTALDEMKRRKGELNRRRQAALELIFDEKAYPYDDARRDHGERAQREVDRRVGVVRELWQKRDQLPLKLDPAAGTAMEELCDADRNVVELGGTKAVDPGEQAQVSLAAAGPVRLAEFCLDERDAETRDWNRRVRAFRLLYRDEWDEMRADELKVVDLTNEYREMMGQPLLEPNDALARAARKHSEWMGARQRIDHEEDVPERRGLGARLALEQYDGAVHGENLAFGIADAATVVAGWRSSSGHHRNLLDAAYNQLGTGKVGLYWTQDFGRGKPLGKE